MMPMAILYIMIVLNIILMIVIFTTHTTPTRQHLTFITGAASDLWDAVPPETQKRAAELVLPAVAASPAGHGKSASEMAMPEALLVLAGQLNRNGYSVSLILFYCFFNQLVLNIVECFWHGGSTS